MESRSREESLEIRDFNDPKRKTLLAHDAVQKRRSYYNRMFGNVNEGSLRGGVLIMLSAAM